MKSILFVCLGNICRSPTAEAVFRKKFSELKIDIHVDSAGTSSNHVGERSDPRSIKHAEKRDYEMTHLAQQFTTRDFDNYDLILVMDQSNYQNVLKLAKTDLHRAKTKQISEYLDPNGFAKKFNHIPDPYYGDAKDFELVIDLIEETFDGFIKSL